MPRYTQQAKKLINGAIMGEMKATAIAHPNLALIKYWGKMDEVQLLPMNGSISVTLDSYFTTVTVEFSDAYDKDIATINGNEIPENTMIRLVKHIDRIRELSGVKLKARGEARLNFPIGAGLASSSSGFAALTLAASTAAGMTLNKKELSILSRQGSGSSSRSVYGGFVEWLKGSSSEESYAAQIKDEKWWPELKDIAIVVSTSARKVDTRGGMKIAKDTSPYYSSWLENVSRDLESMRKAINDKDFTLLGKIAERNSLMMHGTAISSTPPLIYWVPETVLIMQEVLKMREDGIECYFTLDTGANIHILSMNRDVKHIIERIEATGVAKSIGINGAGSGAEIIDKPLF
jgi:diphosphomevalonate decarboxylase